jgi:Plasmid pRiA4b ORF-3-like protein
MPTKPTTGGDIIRLTVTLRDIDPPIWRRLLLPATMTLRDLHRAIQSSLEWHESHLHGFEIAGERYGDPGMTEDDEIADEARLTLAELHERGIARFRYTYDFGDDWEHDIAIEGSEPAVARQSYPTCVAGERAGPPEDCGGFPGYEELVAILADPRHPERKERLAWIGRAYDPEAFSLKKTNARLAARFRSAKR